MAITTTRAKRADRWRTMRALAAAALTISLLQVTAPAVSMAQVATAAKKPVHHRITKPTARSAKPAAKSTADTKASPTDNQADELNKKWLSEYKANAAATDTAKVTTTPSVAGTETERTLSAPTAVPSAAARAVVPGTITYVKADSAAAAFNSMPGGANQPLFKDLTKAFAGFSPSKAKVEMLQAQTADGSSRVIYASIGEGKGKHSFWWFAPPDEPEGWFDEHGRRLGGAALTEPKPGARISSPFGTRRYYGRITSHAFHNGIDFEGHVGDPIYAAADGVVNHADWYYNYGRTVKISHSEHFETLYAHMSRIAPGIAPGTVVHKGEVIGYVGATGRATGPHLHFSAIVDGRFVDPERYLSTKDDLLTANDLVAYRKWQQDVRDAAIAQKPRTEHASFWSRNPFTPPPSPGRL
ncbi:M23 family metallopeptidase [Enhydrobacter sp.]|jgi:murein DD-endopeptidase MepM/ murein hydrolase activator NlpD|uniref:M23 family metallopeptidase n=1 Tax=Enhydrobacter sp. TaxID=1894999 RepID=UPI002638AAA9|nr:M23 family metallopeptidase [Enhydrobacter sp.]WIM14405.1 MAG: Peptidase, M23/M37 family [Enhydrobacter sp.]